MRQAEISAAQAVGGLRKAIARLERTAERALVIRQPGPTAVRSLAQAAVDIGWIERELRQELDKA